MENGGGWADCLLLDVDRKEVERDANAHIAEYRHAQAARYAPRIAYDDFPSPILCRRSQRRRESGDHRAMSDHETRNLLIVIGCLCLLVVMVSVFVAGR